MVVVGGKKLYVTVANFFKKCKIRLLTLEREEGGERNTDWLPLIHTPTGDQTQNLGMCPD